MILVFNYITDYGVEVGFYPARVGDESNLDFLPNELRELYSQENDSFRGCRTSNLTPRKVKLQINTNNTLEIELPVRPTIAQLQTIKNNSNAIVVQTIGEIVKYPKLRYRYVE